MLLILLAKHGRSRIWMWFAVLSVMNTHTMYKIIRHKMLTWGHVQCYFSFSGDCIKWPCALSVEPFRTLVWRETSHARTMWVLCNTWFIIYLVQEQICLASNCTVFFLFHSVLDAQCRYFFYFTSWLIASIPTRFKNIDRCSRRWTEQL